MTPLFQPGQATRQAGVADLAAELQLSRRDTLATFAACEAALPDLSVPQHETLNPPLWELGHVGWFQEFWISRNSQRQAGSNADPSAPRSKGVRPQADALYNASEVPHAARWVSPLPDADATRADLAAQLGRTLELLHMQADDDAALYFFRLALMHEDMHHEAALYMAQSLGVPIADARWQPAPQGNSRGELAFDAGPWTLGHSGQGFAFDNELGAHVQHLPHTHIDSCALRWADYLPFVEAGGYKDPGWWSEAGRTWLMTEQPTAPRYLRRGRLTWEQWRYGHWAELDLAGSACHLTAFEADAWCRWAGRRLPCEGEWERAALARPHAFERGQVWEWTASPFEPYPGFVAHPYRDYSAPWFGSRRVLRGSSFMTQPRMSNARYRNFFAPCRNDVPAGFRSCRL